MKYLFLALLCLSTSLYSQKCKYLVNKVSGMDGSHLVITEPLVLSNNFGEGEVKVWSTIYGDTTLVVAFVFELKQELILNKGDSILTRLKTGEEIYLELIQNSVSKDVNSRKVITALTAIDKEFIKQYQSQLVDEIQVSSKGSVIKGTTDKKNYASAIRTVINCVFRYLN